MPRSSGEDEKQEKIMQPCIRSWQEMSMGVKQRMNEGL